MMLHSPVYSQIGMWKSVGQTGIPVDGLGRVKANAWTAAAIAPGRQFREPLPKVFIPGQVSPHLTNAPCYHSTRVGRNGEDQREVTRFPEAWTFVEGMRYEGVS